MRWRTSTDNQTVSSSFSLPIQIEISAPSCCVCFGCFPAINSFIWQTEQFIRHIGSAPTPSRFPTNRWQTTGECALLFWIFFSGWGLDRVFFKTKDKIREMNMFQAQNSIRYNVKAINSHLFASNMFVVWMMVMLCATVLHWWHFLLKKIGRSASKHHNKKSDQIQNVLNISCGQKLVVLLFRCSCTKRVFCLCVSS